MPDILAWHNPIAIIARPGENFDIAVYSESKPDLDYGFLPVPKSRTHTIQVREGKVTIKKGK